MLYPILALVVLALDVYAILSVLAGTGTTEHKALWIILILLLPVLGLVLYFLVGRSPRDA